MKNVKNVNRANFWQIDHKIRNLLGVEGVVVLGSERAWEGFKWVRQIIKEKPKEGYFIWVKNQVDFPLFTCITIASPKISQNLTNLMVIEKNIKVKANVLCNAAGKKLCGIHKAVGKLILKEGAALDYNHIHRWGEKDFVSPHYEFFLGKNSKLLYNYQNLFPPENLDLKTKIHSGENSSVNVNFVVNGLKSKIKINDSVILEGNNSQAVVRLRLVGKKESLIDAKSTILAKSASKGHLDCQGLLADKKAKILLTPQLLCENKSSQITHEASLGKISEEELNYLRTRGFSEKEAIDLIISGFLNI